MPRISGVDIPPDKNVIVHAAMGDPASLARPEFDEARSRQAHRDELLPLLEEIFERENSDAWLDRLQAAGVPAAPVNRMPALFTDPNVEARQMIRSFAVGDDEVHAVGNAIKVVGEAEPRPQPPPETGADTEWVLRDLLGYDDERIAALRERGVVGEAVSAR